MIVDEGDIIETEGRWSLVRVPDYQNWESWVVHNCEGPVSSKTWQHKLGYYAACYDKRKTCDICEEKIPDRIMTIWTLHNFDCIQRHKG